jgi:hypothetical protein
MNGSFFSGINKSTILTKAIDRFPVKRNPAAAFALEIAKAHSA